MKKTSISVYEWFVAVCFMLGSIIGCVLSNNTDTTSLTQAVTSYLDGFSVGYNSFYLFFTNVLNNLKFPIIIAIFSFTVFGVAVIPLCIGVRGYALAFSITSFLRVLGLSSFKIVLLTIGISSFFLLPCLVLLSVTAIRISMVSLRVNFLHVRASKAQSASNYIPMLITYFIITIFVACVCAAIDSFIVPYFLTSLS